MSGVISLNKGEVINLSKMPTIDLSKGGRGLKKVIVGLGWDPVDKIETIEKRGFFSRLFGGDSVSVTSGEDIDCDAFAFILRNGKFISDKDLVYFGELETSDGSIRHTGDNLTGEGDGDDEQIIIDLDSVKAEDICIAVNIYRGRDRRQHFGMLQNAFIRIVDMETNTELCRYTLDNKYSGYVSVIFGELVKRNDEWSFEAKGEPVDARSISEVVRLYN